MNKEGYVPPNKSPARSARVSQIVLYAIFLAPISLVVAGDGVSANYLFAILLVAPGGYKRNPTALAYVVFITLAFFLGIFIFSGFDEYFLLRQTISFCLALVAALLLFVRLKVQLEEFLVAVVAVSVVYSTFVLWVVATHGFSLADIYFIKGGLREFVTDWPQRYVVVLMFAFFVAVRRWSRGITWSFASMVIFTCIFLTFTRSAWLGVFVGTIVYNVFRERPAGYARRATKTHQVWRYVAVMTFFIAAIVSIRDHRVVAAFMQIVDNLRVVAQSGVGDFDPESSEGIRVGLWSSVISLVRDSPLSGTGFAGANLVVEGAGSAHSQYMDMLLRTGVPGLAFYLWFCKRLLTFYGRVDRGILAGLVAILVFGLFNETTKLSYGALIFFVLLNKTYGSGPTTVTALQTNRTSGPNQPCAAS